VEAVIGEGCAPGVGEHVEGVLRGAGGLHEPRRLEVHRGALRARGRGSALALGFGVTATSSSVKLSGPMVNV
jgi:hypothetical protein